MFSWIKKALGAEPAAQPASVPGSSVLFSEYKVRALFRRRTATHLDAWYPAAHPDEAMAAARKRFPTADGVEYLGERRDLTEAEIDALRRASAGA